MLYFWRPLRREACDICHICHMVNPALPEYHEHKLFSIFCSGPGSLEHFYRVMFGCLLPYELLGKN